MALRPFPMKIYHSLDDFARLPYAVVTSGTFDGVHVGHQKILKRLSEIAQRHSGETVVITFWPHPRLVLKPEDRTLKLLNTFEEKASLLKEQGIQHLLRIPFTKEFSQLSSIDFIRNILVERIGTRKLVIGYDHRFGKNREGSFEALLANGPAYGFDVEEIPEQDIDHIAISSSKIRSFLEAGCATDAAHLLGRPYAITGRVIQGDKIGRTLGYPTANLEVDSQHKLIPADGIYAVSVVQAGQKYGGMLYIGNRPTLNGTRRSIEVNIFNFEKDIYGEDITVHFEALLRLDSRFSNLDELKRQLHDDKVAALRILNV